MASNLLVLNKEKTQMMVITKNKSLKTRLRILATPKDITHSKYLKILGIDIAQDLNWKFFLLDGKSSIYKQLTTRINALKKNHQFQKTQEHIIRNLHVQVTIWG